MLYLETEWKITEQLIVSDVPTISALLNNFNFAFQGCLSALLSHNLDPKINILLLSIRILEIIFFFSK